MGSRRRRRGWARAKGTLHEGGNIWSYSGRMVKASETGRWEGQQIQGWHAQSAVHTCILK